MKGQTRGHRIVGPLHQPRFERHFFGTATAVVMTAISIAISVASAAMAYVQQQQAAKDNARYQAQQMEAQNEVIRQNSALANAEFMRQSKAIQARQAEEDAAAVGKEIDVSRESAKARSTATVAAGEAGVNGLSVDMLGRDFMGQEAAYRNQTRTNLENTRQQTVRDLEGAQLTAQGRVNSEKPFIASPVHYPSMLGAALRVGADAASTVYTNHFKGRPEQPAPVAV